MISDINPADVALNYTVADTVLSVTFGQLDGSLRDSIRMGLAQGLAIGAATVLMFVSWFTIINKKTPMFVLHQLALFFLIVRSSLYLGYLFGPFNSLSFTYTGLFYGYWSSFHVTIAVNTFYVLLIACIECILVYQIHVIFKSTKARWSGYLFSLFSAMLGVVVVVLYMISITHNLMLVKAEITDGFAEYASWETNLPFIMFSASVNYTCVLLIAKLIFAVRTRRVLGLKQFDAMHILLITSTQTCMIPSILLTYSYANTLKSSVYLNISVIITVCNLPFSSLWASSSNKASVPSSCQNSFFSRTSSHDSSDRTLSSFYKVQKTGSPLSDYEKGTLAEPISDAAGMQTDVDSIEKILREVEQQQAYEQ